MSIVLESARGSLSLALDEQGIGGWCQVQLLVSGVGRALGAETLSYIASHLLFFLREPEPKLGLRWVFTLFEIHTSAYGEHIGTTAVLHLHDADAKCFRSLVLTPTEQERWMRELSQHYPVR